MPVTTKISPKTKTYIHAIGRRKSATARIRLYQKKGESLVNEKPFKIYFPSPTDQAHVLKPLALTGTADKFHFTVKVSGGGYKAQSHAVCHGLARSLSSLDPQMYRPTLKKAGLLTRDPRMKESRHVGTGGKARRQKQSPKR